MARDGFDAERRRQMRFAGARAVDHGWPVAMV